MATDGRIRDSKTIIALFRAKAGPWIHRPGGWWRGMRLDDGAVRAFRNSPRPASARSSTGGMHRGRGHGAGRLPNLFAGEEVRKR